MKFFTLFIIAFLTSALTAQTIPNFTDRMLERLREPINRLIINSIENQRVNFPVGWPELGIPPLDPLFIVEYEFSTDQIANLASFNFQLQNGYMNGLKKFQVRFLDARFTRTSFAASLFFPELEITGDHRSTVRISAFPITGSGDVKISMRRMTVEMSARLEVINGDFLNLDDFVLRINVREASARFTGFGLLDDTVSNAVTSSLAGMINLSNGAMIGEPLKLAINSLINQIRLSDIIDAVTR